MTASLAVALGAAAIALSLHGLGRLAGHLAGDRDAPAPLAIAWGLAVYLGLGGWLAAAGLFSHPVQRALQLAGLVASAVWLAPPVRAWIRRTRPLAWRPTAGTVVTVAITLAVAVHTLGEAGTRDGAFLDADGDLLGPITRLAETGALPDAASRPRTAGLGGTAIAHSLTTLLGDARTAHAIDGGLALALLLGLLFAMRRGPARPYAGFAVAAIALGLPSLVPDLAPRWTVAALAVATLSTLRRDGPHAAALAALLAAAAATVAHGGLALVAVVIIAIAKHRPNPNPNPNPNPMRYPLAVAAAVLTGYLVALLRAHLAVPAAPPLVAPGLLVRLAIAIPAAAVLWALLASVSRRTDDPQPRFLLAIAAAVAISLAFALSPTAGAIAAAPFLLAALLVLLLTAIEDLRPPLAPAAVALVALAVLALGGLRFPLGLPPRTSGERAAHLVDRARASVPEGDDRATTRRYRAALASLRPGARVGVWVDRPDLLDPTRHQLVDLRTTAALACRAPRTSALALLRPAAATCRAVRALPSRLALDALVLAPEAALPVDDPLRALAAAGRTIAAETELTVVEITPAARP